MDQLMEFLNLPGIPQAIITMIVAFASIMTAMALWIRYDGKRRDREAELRWQVALEKAKADAAALVKEAERKADAAKAELQEGQTLADTLRLLVKLQEQSLILQDTNAQHNRAEREESRKAHLEALDRVTETFSARQGQLAGNLAANTEAMVAVASRVETINTTVGAGVTAIQGDLAALTQAVNDLIAGLKSHKACEDEVKPLLKAITAQLTALQQPGAGVSVIDITPPPDTEPQAPAA